MQCPICKKPVSENVPSKPGGKDYHPFCSERCKLIDLGRWLGGKYQIPVDRPEPRGAISRDTDEDDNSDRLRA